MSTKEQKAVVHILKNKYSISDEQYKTLLYDYFKVSSSVDLTEEECDEFIHLLNYDYNNDYRLGFDNGLKRFYNFFNDGSLEGFERAINITQKRDITEVEKIMFTELKHDERIQVLKILFNDWNIKEV